MNLFSMVPKAWLAYIVAGVTVLGGSSLYFYEKGKSESKQVILDYKNQVTDLNAKLATKDANSKAQIIVKYKTKVVHIKDVGDHNANVAKTIVPSSCNVSSGWVSTHDASATGIKVDPIAGANGADSGIKDTEALSVVNENYGLFWKQKEQLDRLQEEINQHNADIDAANKEAAKKKHWWNR